jgi:site-specific DNA-methyltransferase (adenine-specific)
MIQPYYSHAGITIYHGDCREILPTLSPVDCVLTDPPYAAETHTGARTAARQAGDYHKQNAGVLIDFAAFTEADQRECFTAIAPLARRWVVSFMDWRHIYHFEHSPPPGLRFVRFGLWVKGNGAPQFTGDRPATGWEGIAIMHKVGGRMRWNGGGSPGVW